MKTRLSPDNPLGYTRAGYAWEKVPRDGRSHLDFGCYRGDFLHALAAKGPRRLVGVDASREAIQAGQTRYPELHLSHLPDATRLPFDDATFDSASILDVIEHVVDPKRVLDELYRVLAPQGVLIVTVPRQYVLSFTDLGNLKFRFPRLHRSMYCMLHSREEYEYRYVSNPDGLIGDVSAAKAWHEHFTPESLTRLLGPSGFEPVEFDGSAFWDRPLTLAKEVANRVPVARSYARWVIQLDARLFSSMNLFCLARKRPTATSHRPASTKETAPP